MVANEATRCPIIGFGGRDYAIPVSWAARRVWRLSLAGEIEACVEVDFLPDNLRWMADGRLLLAGQADRPEAVFGCEARGELCPLAFSVVAVDIGSLRIDPLLRVSHEQAIWLGFGGATGALEVEGEIWVGSFTGERVARFSMWRAQ